jgi:hypothetical protein
MIFRHVPKTGGRTLTAELSRGDVKLLEAGAKNQLLPHPYSEYPLQHQYYSTIHKFRDLCGVKFDDTLRVVTIVRNPYHRSLSSFLFNVRIDGLTQDEIYTKLEKHLDWEGNLQGNHNVPQHKFLIDDGGALVEGITVFRTESLNEDASKAGFNLRRTIGVGDMHDGSKRSRDYLKYLNARTIELIDRVCAKDFELLGYDKIAV